MFVIFLKAIYFVILIMTINKAMGESRSLFYAKYLKLCIPILKNSLKYKIITNSEVTKIDDASSRIYGNNLLLIVFALVIPLLILVKGFDVYLLNGNMLNTSIVALISFLAAIIVFAQTMCFLINIAMILLKLNYLKKIKETCYYLYSCINALHYQPTNH